MYFEGFNPCRIDSLFIPEIFNHNPDHLQLQSITIAILAISNLEE